MMGGSTLNSVTIESTNWNQCVGRRLWSLMSTEINWSWAENVDLQFGANIGLGPDGREFQGLEDPASGLHFEHPDFLFGFLKYYF